MWRAARPSNSSLAASVKKRSMRPEEWSGPWPSYPWGQKQDNSGVLSPLVSPEEMYSSTHGLSAIDEVTELGFPHGESLGAEATE